MKHVFISYSSQDIEDAQRIRLAIEERGHRCWIAERDIPPGENYQDTIVRAIRDASAFILILSQNSNNSDEVEKELSLASQYRLLVVPVRIENVSPADAFRYELSTRQWIDIFDNWDDAIARISKQIEIGRHASSKVSTLSGPIPSNSHRGSRSLYAFLVLSVIILGAGATGWWWWWSKPYIPGNYPPAPPAADSALIKSFNITISVGSQSLERQWDRVTSDRWVEKYSESDTKVTHDVVTRIILNGCSGTVVKEQNKKRILAFIPDKDCSGRSFLISHSSDQWGIAGPMTDIK